jgi:hypothetical protein
MERLTIHLPASVLKTLKENYRGYSMMSARKGLDAKGRIHYSVNLLWDEKYYHLKIGEDGTVKESSFEPQFTNGFHEQYF